MKTSIEPQTTAGRRLPELLTLFFIVVGILLVILSLFLGSSPDLQTVVRSLGLSLAPAGVVTLFIGRYVSDISQSLLRISVEKTIKDHLEQDIARIESAVATRVSEMDKKVEDGLDQIQRGMQGLSPLFLAAANLGVTGVYLNRSIALEDFVVELISECQKAERKEKAQVWIVSSSLKGFLNICTEHFDGKDIMKRIAQSGCDLRIMMTDPKSADWRANQEKREPGEIPQEVEMSLADLRRIKVKRKSVRYYPGAPTVYAIATADAMLLNPYPYQHEAFRCFSIIVKKTQDHNTDIYHQYLGYHFQEPWEKAREVSLPDWNKLRWLTPRRSDKSTTGAKKA